MKSFLYLLSFAIAISLVACGGSGKKVKIMASGKITVSGTTIALEPGTTHNEQELTVSGDKITVTNGGVSTDYPVTEPGLYLLNLKTDTLVGSYQHVGTESISKTLTQEDLSKSIDSLQQLMAGNNVSASNRNYCIAPNKIIKITTNTKADIIGPYLKMPGSFEGGKEYEIYKFSTNKEIMEVVEKLRKLQ